MAKEDVAKKTRYGLSGRALIDFSAQTAATIERLAGMISSFARQSMLFKKADGVITKDILCSSIQPTKNMVGVSCLRVERTKNWSALNDQMNDKGLTVRAEAAE